MTPLAGLWRGCAARLHDSRAPRRCGTVHKIGNAQKRPIWGMFCRPWIYIRKRAKCPFSRILEAVAAIWPEKRP